MYLSVGPAGEAAPDICSLSLWDEVNFSMSACWLKQQIKNTY